MTENRKLDDMGRPPTASAIRASNFLQKIRNLLDFPHDQSVPFRRPKSGAAVPRFWRGGKKGARNFFQRKSGVTH
jgi:hypothetical protein